MLLNNPHSLLSKQTKTMKKFFLLKRRSKAVEELIQQAISVLEKLKSRRRAQLAFLILLSNKSSERIRVNSFTIYSMRQEEDGVVVVVMKACCQWIITLIARLSLLLPLSHLFTILMKVIILLRMMIWYGLKTKLKT